MLSDKIYKRGSDGKLRSWQYEVEGSRYRTIAGLLDGNLVTSAWTQAKGKQGRTDEQQAAKEAEADETKKLDREYRGSVMELDAVPPSPMLACKYEDVRPKILNWPLYSQPKLDGIRALISRHGAFSREYQPHLNVEHITEALAPVFAADPDIILDGELYNHALKDDFGAISSIVRKQNPTAEQRAIARDAMQFHVYDQINMRHPNAKFGARWHDLTTCVAPAVRSDCIVFVVTSEVSSQEWLDEKYGAYLQDGYEGQMVRVDAPYEVDKRSKSLLKRKEFITAEFKLLRIEEGQGNWAGYAKRAVFELPDGRECGSGIRGTQDEMRELLANNWTLGQAFVTIRHFTPTPDGMPRFPVAIDFHWNGRTD